MAKKKEFTATPAMSFISQESIDKVDGKKNIKELEIEVIEKDPPKSEPQMITLEEKKPKKSQKPPEGYKPNPEYIETKSKRVQILVQPSVHEAVRAKAKKLGISTNEAINVALREYIQEER